jgi:SUMO ligase MMS21 Smc5/6 complex component
MVERLGSGRLGQADQDNVAQLYIDMHKELCLVEERKVDKGEDMVSFKRAVWEAGHPDEPFMLSGDDDIAVMVTNNADNFTCPITRMDLEEPVKNTCGHVYSKAAILHYLKKQRGGQGACPVAGCPARVTVQSLVDDETTKLRMEKAKKKKRKRTETQKEVEDL